MAGLISVSVFVKAVVGLRNISCFISHVFSVFVNPDVYSVVQFPFEETKQAD